MYQRPSGRRADELRPVKFVRGFTRHAEGSVLVEFGHTRVLCTASIEDGVPGFLRGKGQGWITAEYGMLPRSTNDRMDRESVKGKIGGTNPRNLTPHWSLPAGHHRSHAVGGEHRGRGLRCPPKRMAERDTAAITGAYVTLADAISWARDKGHVSAKATVLRDSVSAVSVGIVEGEPMLDLAYVEDVAADTDMNVVVTGRGSFVEVQGTAEGTPFERSELDRLLDLALAGTTELARIQREALGESAG